MALKGHKTNIGKYNRSDAINSASLRQLGIKFRDSICLMNSNFVLGFRQSQTKGVRPQATAIGEKMRFRFRLSFITTVEPQFLLLLSDDT